MYPARAWPDYTDGFLDKNNNFRRREIERRYNRHGLSGLTLAGSHHLPYARLVQQQSRSPDTTAGLIYGVLAYLCWALIPIFFRLTRQMPPLLVLGHRIIWSFLFFVILIALERRMGDLLSAARSKRILLALLVSALLVATNWGTFIYAVSINQVVQSALGYFMCPLINVALGVIALKERFRRW